MVTEDQLTQFVGRCQEILDAYMREKFPSLPREVLSFTTGKRYARIVKTTGTGSTRSAWAFVDLTNGDVLKCAGWSAPAKHARGNIYDADKGMRFIGPGGPAYLR